MTPDPPTKHDLPSAISGAYPGKNLEEIEQHEEKIEPQGTEFIEIDVDIKPEHRLIFSLIMRSIYDARAKGEIRELALEWLQDNEDPPPEFSLLWCLAQFRADPEKGQRNILKFLKKIGPMRNPKDNFLQPDLIRAVLLE